MKKAIYLIILLIVSVLTGCTGRGGSNEAVQAQDTIYTRQAAMSIYAYQPVRALQIIDSAVTVGNLSQWQADVCRARIYSFTQMHAAVDSLLGGPEDIRLDTAQAIGERLLSHNSVRANLKRQHIGSASDKISSLLPGLAELRGRAYQSCLKSLPILSFSSPYYKIGASFFYFCNMNA